MPCAPSCDASNKYGLSRMSSLFNLNDKPIIATWRTPDATMFCAARSMRSRLLSSTPRIIGKGSAHSRPSATKARTSESFTVLYPSPMIRAEVVLAPIRGHEVDLNDDDLEALMLRAKLRLQEGKAQDAVKTASSIPTNAAAAGVSATDSAARILANALKRIPNPQTAPAEKPAPIKAN